MTNQKHRPVRLVPKLGLVECVCGWQYSNNKPVTEDQLWDQYDEHTMQ